MVTKNGKPSKSKAAIGITTFLCSKIVLNPKEKIEIKAPKNGKKVTQKEFDEIEEKKLNSMKNEDGVIEIKM